MKEITANYITHFFNEHTDLVYLKNTIEDTITAIYTAVKNGKKILVCGNGGSTADSEHIAGELLKGFALKRPICETTYNALSKTFGEDGEFVAQNMQTGIKCIPLTSFSAFNTAFINDCNEKVLFAQLVNTLGDEGDILISISTSGNSKNVCYASQVARIRGIKVIGLTGEKGGKLKGLSDYLLNAPSNIVYKIQEYHLPIYHLLCLCLESEMFDK